jgi:hypothetical protein
MSYSEVIEICNLTDQELRQNTSHFTTCKFRPLKCNICDQIVLNDDRYKHRTTCKSLRNNSMYTATGEGFTPGGPQVSESKASAPRRVIKAESKNDMDSFGIIA